MADPLNGLNPDPQQSLADSKHTLASMQALNCCSTAAHPCGLNPDEAQQPATGKAVSALKTSTAADKQHIPKTDVMIPIHGFISILFGRRTRRLGRGGKRVGVSFVDLAGMVAEGWRVPEKLR